MKKIIFIFTVLSITLLTGCSNKETLYLLNWGDYINQDVVDLFEDKYDVKVVIETVDSNEMMDTKISTKSANYDIAFPSDYMIDKLLQEDKLITIDKDKLSNYSTSNIDQTAYNYFKDTDIEQYGVPYFWGNVGIMYNNTNTTLVNELTNNLTAEDEKVNDILFGNNSYSKGMYNSSRDAIGQALVYLGYDINTTVQIEIDEAVDLLSSVEYTFGTDDLKVKVADGILDLALVYSGDYFEQLFIYEEEGLDVEFSYIVPEDSNIWIDYMVIPNTSKNTELAHKFIDFMLEKENNLQNSDYVGYCPPYNDIYNTLIEVPGEYEYDYENYYPIGTQEITRNLQMYEYVSIEHVRQLDDALIRVISE